VGSSTIAVKQGRHKGWDSWHIQNGALELVLVPQVGGRIIGMIWRGHDLSFTLPELEGKVEELSGVQDLNAKKRKMGFPLWGGDKTWLAPQTRWTDGVPFLDLDSGPYELEVVQPGPEAAVVRMTSRVCRETGIQVTRTVSLAAGSQEWTVTHQLSNHSSQNAHWGVWDVNMLLRPGKVYLPRRADSLFPEGVKTFAGEGESTQVRDQVVGILGSLAVITCTEPPAFKFGVDAKEGWMLGVVEVADLGLVGYRKAVPASLDKTYGHGCIAEVYNSDRYPYFEMEIHGPIVCLRPGKSFELEERQALFTVPQWPQREEEVRAHLEAGKP
jgi:hypothetical protein